MRNHKIFLVALFFFASVAHAAPITTSQPTILPLSNLHFDLGTSTNAWRDIYVNKICLTADTCRTTWPTGGGGGSVAWGDITGTLSNQTDLQSALDAKLNISAFGASFYNFFHATTTDALAQGSTNKYWSQTLFDNALSATTTLPNITTLANLGTVKTSITGVLKASSGVLSAAVSNTDYQAPITLTTTGSSGAATFNGTTLNIPQYSGGGGLSSYDAFTHPSAGVSATTSGMIITASTTIGAGGASGLTVSGNATTTGYITGPLLGDAAKFAYLSRAADDYTILHITSTSTSPCKDTEIQMTGMDVPNPSFRVARACSDRSTVNPLWEIANTGGVDQVVNTVGSSYNIWYRAGFGGTQEAAPRIRFRTDFMTNTVGGIVLGDGTGTGDANLYRGAADTLTTDDSLSVGSQLSVTSTSTLSNTQLGSGKTLVLQASGASNDDKLAVILNSTGAQRMSIGYASTDVGLDINNRSGVALDTFLENGNTGIGTTSPTQRLSVQGSALLSGDLKLANLTATGTATIGTLTGVIKGSSGVLSAAANGTDYTLITANTCSAGNHVSAITAAGVITCSADTGAGGTGLATTSPLSSGNVLAYTGSSQGAAYGVGTTTFTPSAAFSTTGTIGSFIGGANSTLDLATNGVALTKLATIGANTILGNNTGSVGNVVAFATSTLGIAISDTTGTLSVSRGGTGQVSFTSGNLLYGAGSGALQNAATTTFAAANSTLSITGTLGALIGGANSTIGLNLGNANTWSATTTFTPGLLVGTAGALFSNTGTTTIQDTNGLQLGNGSHGVRVVPGSSTTTLEFF